MPPIRRKTQTVHRLGQMGLAAFSAIGKGHNAMAAKPTTSTCEETSATSKFFPMTRAELQVPAIALYRIPAEEISGETRSRLANKSSPPPLRQTFQPQSPNPKSRPPAQALDQEPMSATSEPQVAGARVTPSARPAARQESAKSAVVGIDREVVFAREKLPPPRPKFLDRSQADVVFSKRQADPHSSTTNSVASLPPESKVPGVAAKQPSGPNPAVPRPRTERDRLDTAEAKTEAVNRPLPQGSHRDRVSAGDQKIATQPMASGEWERSEKTGAANPFLIEAMVQIVIGTVLVILLMHLTSYIRQAMPIQKQVERTDREVLPNETANAKPISPENIAEESHPNSRYPVQPATAINWPR